MNRKQHLLEIGYHAPLDESPVEIPPEWEKGAVENTGGNIFCRIWETDTTSSEDEPEYRVIYNLRQDRTVSLCRLVYDPDVEAYTHEENLRSQKAENQTDEAMAKEAKELMEYASANLLNESADSPNNTDFGEKTPVATIEQMEHDVKAIKSEMGIDIEVHEEMEGYYLLLLDWNSRFDIIDEPMNRVRDRGYGVAYVDFGKNKIAFEPDDDSPKLSDDIYADIKQSVSLLDVTRNGEISIEDENECYVVSVPYEGKLRNSEISDKVNDDGSIISKKDYTIFFEGVTDKLILLVEDRT